MLDRLKRHKTAPINPHPQNYPWNITSRYELYFVQKTRWSNHVTFKPLTCPQVGPAFVALSGLLVALARVVPKA